MSSLLGNGRSFACVSSLRAFRRLSGRFCAGYGVKGFRHFLRHGHCGINPSDGGSTPFHTAEPCHLAFGKLVDGGFELVEHLVVGQLSDDVQGEVFVFQSVSLIPSMNAFQNVEFSMRLAGINKGREERVRECLKMVGLGSRMNHMPAEMSGGEQQRVAIARAIAHRPSIILADEPTAELDSAMAAEVTQLFKEMTRKENVSIVMTTHDTGLMDAGDMIIELENGQQIIRPETSTVM